MKNFGALFSLLRLFAVAWFLAGSTVRGDQTISLTCPLGGIVEIGNVGEVFPSAVYDRMDIRLTTVPGVAYGRISRITNTEEYVWGTVGANTFAPATSQPFNQNRIHSGNSFRYVNHGAGVGQSEVIPVRFTDAPGFTKVDYTILIKIVPAEGVATIVKQPQGLIPTIAGTAATMSVEATGAEPLSYQWYEGIPPNTLRPIAGATEKTYVSSAALPAGQHHYFVRVSNEINAVSSLGVTLAVGNVPVAVSGGPYFVEESGSVTLHPSAIDSSSQFFAYAWDLNGDDLFGMLSSEYGPEFGPEVVFTPTGLPTGTVKTIKVRVTNQSDLSDTATTTVTVVNTVPRANFSIASGVVSFTDVTDTPDDIAAGIRFSYDFDGDGVYEVTDTTAPSMAIPAEFLGNYNKGIPVIGRVRDRKGGETVYTAVNGEGILVTTLEDEDDGDINPQHGTGTSFREAVQKANAAGGNAAIYFAPKLFADGPATITLTRGWITLANPTSNIIVAGPGPAGLTISGGNTQQIFRNISAHAAIYRLTLANGGGNQDGSALYNYGSLTISDCVFVGNVSPGAGGAIYNGGEARIQRSTFLNNAASPVLGGSGRGGAIANEGIIQLHNCTFYGNKATGATVPGAGGALANLFGSSRATIVNSTFTGNSADGAGGALAATTGLIFASNSILSGNTAPDGANIAGTLSASGLESNLIDANPAAIFTTGVPADNGGLTLTMALKQGGPAINAGTNSLAVDADFAALTQDQRTRARVLGGTVDIGAYEATLLPDFVSANVTGITSTSATVSGSASGDSFAPITRQGVVYARTVVNAAPALSGPGVVAVDGALGTGNVTVDVTGLTPLTGYSFATFVINSGGTVYSPVGTFFTSEQPGLMVTVAGDVVDATDGQTSLREALAYAQSVGGAPKVTFAVGLAGQTVTLSEGWNGADDVAALRVAGKVTLEGPVSAPGITVAIGASVLRRHLMVEGPGELEVSNLTFTNGSGDYGGSIRSFGKATIRGCTFTGNFAALDGGAVHGGPDSPWLLIENCTFSGNSSGLISSAIATGAQQTTLRHLTVTGNSAPAGSGGAILLYQYPATMVNSIVAGNTNDGIIALLGAAFSAESTNNLLGAGGAGGLANGTNFIGVDAARLHLGTLGNHGGPTPTIDLRPGSPAMNAGTVVAGLNFDQRGLARAVGTAPDLGALEDATGDDDPDRDGLGNARELALGTDPLAIDSDGDGFNDATEMLSGSDPVSAASVPAATHIERVLGYGAARGLDLSGAFLYAAKIGPGGAAGQAGDANFTTDNVPGLTVRATSEIADWNNPSFGAGAADDALETVFRSIRWSNHLVSTPEARRLEVDLAGLAPGRKYKLQLLFGEAGAVGRTFDVFVDGVLVVGRFQPAEAQGVVPLAYAASAIVHEFVASGPVAHVVLDSASIAAGPGVNLDPILSGVTLEALPTALDAWRGLNGLAADGSQDLATPASDGIANLLKYAFNLATNPSDLELPAIGLLPAAGGAGLPAYTRDAEGRLVITFVRRKAATNPGVAYTVLTGEEVANLQPLDLSDATITPLDAIWERVTAVDPATTDQRFGCVRVSVP